MTEDEAAAALADSETYRVLRRLEPELIDTTPSGGPVRRAVFLDSETTGTDVEQDEVIELSMVAFDYDAEAGTVSRVYDESAFEGLRDPGRPIPPEAAKVNNITDEMVAGKTITDAEVEVFLEGVSLVIAHSASFDRPMVEKTWPVFRSLHWACSIEDMDWKNRGFGSNSLEYLLMKQGYFFEGHRAKIDCLAGVALLAMPLPDGEPALRILLESARKPRTLVRAVNSPFETKDSLKARGYRWDNAGRAWWTVTEDIEAEKDWLTEYVYGGRLPGIPMIRLTAKDRFRPLSQLEGWN